MEQSEVVTPGEPTFIRPSFRFPGQQTDEIILYVTRMHLFALIKNIFLITLGFGVIAFSVAIITNFTAISLQLASMLVIVLILTVIFWLFASWWAFKVFRNTYFVITDRRLVKLGYTTPFTRYQSSLNLSEIQDSAATSKKIIEQILNIGTFYARSSAAALRDFWFEYLEYHVDVHNYINKLLYILRTNPKGAEELKNFRPFIPKPAGKRY